MLSRSRKLRLSDGTTLTTPLLIPSVSSKGFGVRPDGPSDVAACLKTVGHSVADALLVSAYDLHHRLLPEVDLLLGDERWDTVYNATSLLVIDSGGYELGVGWDSGELYRDRQEQRPFSQEQYEELLSKLPAERNILAVSFDHRTEETPGLADQAAEAAAFAERHPEFMVDLLVKPAEGPYIEVNALAPDVRSLASFDVIGVTETELGDSLLARARTIWQLRSLLDGADIGAPIHVFGVLDPVLVAFYFMAGAELFDGLTWIRYGAHAGLATYRDSVALMHERLKLDTAMRTTMAQLDFLDHLAALRRELSAWAASGGDFSLLSQNAEALCAAYNVLLNDRRGGG